MTVEADVSLRRSGRLGSRAAAIVATRSVKAEIARRPVPFDLADEDCEVERSAIDHVAFLDGACADGVSELAVHVEGRAVVGETVVSSVADTFDADVDGGQQDRVVDRVGPERSDEPVELPWADDAIVNRVVVSHELFRCGRGSIADDMVLLHRLWEPRRNCPGGQESKEEVAFDEHAALHVVGE